MSDDLDVLLRETLRHHLGRSGDEPGDLNEVVRRSRRLLARRRTRLLGAALVAVCALSAVVVTRPFHSATVHPDTSLSGDAADCPRGSNPARLPLPSEGKVRLGAVMASLCPTNGATWTPPEDALTSRLDDLATLINSRPVARDGRGFRCMGMPLINDYAILFLYPDGSTSAVWSSTCADTLRTGPDLVREAGGVLQRYAESLIDQRASRRPSTPVDPPVCPGTDGAEAQEILPGGRSLDLESAVTCTYEWTKVGNGAFTFALTGQSRLTSDVVRRLDQAFESDARPTEPDYEVGHQLQTIIGVTAWGDPVKLELLNGELVRGPSPGDATPVSYGWRLGAAEESELFSE